MVPLSITLRNFLSYGDKEVTLDLSDMHVVCFSGENGHGKSALLDAITWALWGETRLGKQGHEQLIRIGADEMAVTLTFRVGADVYRVKRQRSRRTSGANWEIQRSDGAAGWRPLTGVSSSDTGRTIQQIVRMSFDTFLNSAYLKQGRADEFVRQTSNRRKEILCDILELSRYDRLEELAKVRAKEAAENVLDLDRRTNLQRAIAEEAVRYSAELASAEGELHHREQERSGVVGARQNAERLRSEAAGQIQLRLNVKQRLNAIDSDLKSAYQDMAEITERMKHLRILLKDQAVIEADYRKLLDGRTKAGELSAKLRELHEIEINALNTRKLIENDEQALQYSAAQLRREVGSARVERDRAATLEREIKVSLAKTEPYESLQSRLNELTGLRADLTTLITELRLEHDHIDRDLKNEEARQERLRSQVENCSICGSPLPPEKIESILVESMEAAKELCERKEAVRIKGVAARKNLNDMAAESQQIDTVLAELTGVKTDVVRMEQQLKQATAGSSSLDSLELQLSNLNKTLTSRLFAEELQTKLAQIEPLIINIQLIKTEHAHAEAQISSLSGVEHVYQEVLSAEQKLTSESKNLDLLNRHLRTLESQKLDITAQMDLTNDAESQLAACELKLRKIAAEEQALSKQLSESQNAIGRLQRSLEQCTIAEQQIKSLQKQRDDAKQEELLYKALSAAFGKRGIQASIIESALPELEQYTNEILNRLTDGDLRVFIETTRQAKTKNAALVETLEIKISDSLGTRPLEMYSGGEAFRVSFALRIALSMLLVRRSGAELQTLIIDEGFGTQDAKGREKLVDAINAIKQDFDQIMVITHIDELKEAFATRIEVYKTSEGSQLRVVHGDAIG